MEAIDFINRPLEGVFALLYGESGSGKTHFLATIAELGYVLIVDADKGNRTLQTAPDLKKYWNNIEVVNFNKFADLDALYKLVLKNDPAEWSKVLGKKIERKFDWIALDTWTEMQWIMLQKLRKESGLGGGDNEKLDFRKNIQIQHWGMMTDLNKLSIEAFKSCTHVNIVFVMQECVVQDAITGSITKGPSIHGKLVKEMPAYFETVIHTYNNLQGKWCATTLPKQGWPAKNRIKVGEDKVDPKAADFFKV